jgi:acyl phosphate:glycerol-3-phosphate acyltransferase
VGAVEIVVSVLIGYALGCFQTAYIIGQVVKKVDIRTQGSNNAGASAVLGHIFPFFLRFKGGKGAASLIGMLLAIDIKIAIIAILTIVVITLVIDYIALGSIGMFSVLPLTTYAFNYPLICTLIGVLLALICVYKHQINIKRIIKREETGLRKVVKKN